MNSSPRPLVFALLAALATSTLTTAADPEPDWETTTKYLKKYIEEDGFEYGTPKVVVTTDQKSGTVTVMLAGTVGMGSWKTARTILLRNVDHRMLSLVEGGEFRGTSPTPVRKLYGVSLKSYQPSVENSNPGPCVRIVSEERGGGKPSEVKEFAQNGTTFYFVTEETAKKAMKAFDRAIALAKQADVPDPFADKPKPGAPPAGTTTGPSAAARRKAELEILDLKEKIEKQAKALEAATKAVDDCKQELQKLADLRAKETNEGKRRVIAAARLVMLTQQQEAETKRAACEVALRASKAELERREKALAGLRD